MTIEERLAMLKELTSIKPGSPRAQQILRSLQRYKPKTKSTGTIRLENPVTGVNFTAQSSRNARGTPGYNVGFSTRTGLERPLVPNSKVDLLGIRATVGQGIDQIPVGGNYYFEPVGDERGFNRKNQRALAYKRLTNNAFKAYDTSYGKAGQGTRRGQDKWQPRTAKGRFDKVATWNPGREEVNRLGRMAASTFATRVVGANPYIQAALTVDDIVEAYSGKGLMERFVNFTQEALDKDQVQRPATLIMPR